MSLKVTEFSADAKTVSEIPRRLLRRPKNAHIYAFIIKYGQTENSSSFYLAFI